MYTHIVKVTLTVISQLGENYFHRKVFYGRALIKGMVRLLWRVKSYYVT